MKQDLSFPSLPFKYSHYLHNSWTKLIESIRQTCGYSILDIIFVKGKKGLGINEFNINLFVKFSSNEPSICHKTLKLHFKTLQESLSHLRYWTCAKIDRSLHDKKWKKIVKNFKYLSELEVNLLEVHLCICFQIYLILQLRPSFSKVWLIIFLWIYRKVISKTEPYQDIPYLILVFRK